MDALLKIAASLASQYVTMAYTMDVEYLDLQHSASSLLPLRSLADNDDNDDDDPVSRLHAAVAALPTAQQFRLHGKVWELGMLRGAPGAAHEWEWGRANLFADPARLAAALRRLLGHAAGPFATTTTTTATPGLRAVRLLPHVIGEGGAVAQYFSAADPDGGSGGAARVGYINGMGVCDIGHAHRDAAEVSRRLGLGSGGRWSGIGVRGVYNPSHQGAADVGGFLRDAARMKAIDGGQYARQQYLLVQMWAECLLDGPGSATTTTTTFLQIAHSEGASHVNAAMRLLATECGDDGARLLARLRVLMFAPSYFVDRAAYPAAQVVHFVKRNDAVINPWATGISRLPAGGGGDDRIVVVPHRVHDGDDHNNPHDMMSWDYIEAARPYVERFMSTGDIV
ncbi:hypothetical protein DFJ73DRAFT_966209 [Zopfochytrium polystomum]|nr:hypothetical protein DFJ73DRAFT_966209 [Zopfochytrium polystomum]